MPVYLVQSQSKLIRLCREAHRLLQTCCAVVIAVALPSAALSSTEEEMLSSEQISSYLVAREKYHTKDFIAASEQYRALIDQLPDNLHLLGEAWQVYILEGNTESSLSAAVKLYENGITGFWINNLAIVAAFRDGDYKKSIDLIERLDDIGPEIPLILKAWSQFGAGDVAAVIETFLNLPDDGDLIVDLIDFHRALVLATIGDFGAAEVVFAEIGALDDQDSSIPQSMLTIAHAQTLVQLDRRQDAIALIDDFIREMATPAAGEIMAELRSRIDSEVQVDFDLATSPNDGVARLYQILAHHFAQRNNWEASIILARIAELLEPDNAAISYVLGGYLKNYKTFELAVASLDAIGEDFPAHHFVVIEKSDALRLLDRNEESIAVLQDLANRIENNVEVFMALGDGWLQDKEYENAKSAYSTAVELTESRAPKVAEDGSMAEYFAANWRPLYGRAIARERTGDWLGASADLRRTVQYSDNNPYVLNYLGYSMLLQDEDPVEAESLINAALEAEPENGAFIDSLGWAQFLQGKYEEALPNLEKAVRLLPQVGEVIDHLGDVYWKVGRKREAAFQWRRALLFEDENVDASRVERKIEVGLDQVLQEEFAVENDN